MTHKLVSLMEEVEVTHPRLSRLMAMTIIALKAQQFLLVVSPSGCGKSAVGRVISRSRKDSISFLTITRARLKDYADKLSNFSDVVVMDDISSGNAYERRDTIVTFATLCHEHYVNKHTMVSDYEINNFYGSALLNVQPIILAELYQSSEWESLLQDKSLRYYHLFRPTHPQETPPDINIDWGIDIKSVNQNQEYGGKIYNALLTIAQVQWSDSRAIQHLHQLLKAIVALDGRETATDDDMLLLYALMRPMILEHYLFSKENFEVGRNFDANLNAMLVEFASWGRVDIARIARDYKVRPARVYQILQRMNGWVHLAKSNVIPSESLLKILKAAGIDKRTT